MSTSFDLKAALNDKVINDAFEIAYKDRSGILGVVGTGAPRLAFDGYKLSWVDGEVGATSVDTTAIALVGATTISVDDGSKVRAGMTISPANSDEVILVTAVTGNDLTVTRGFGGSTAAEIASGTTLTIDSVGREENSLAQNDGIYQPDTVENFFQTMDTAIEFSRRALATLQFAGTNDLTFQVSQRIRQLTTQLNRALVRGRKATATIGGETISYTGGIKYFIEQSTSGNNVDNSAAGLSLDAINALNAQIVKNGGTTNTIAVGIDLARSISALVASNYNSDRLANWTADEGSVLRLPSDIPLVGNVNQIVIDTNLNSKELLIFDSNMISVVPMAANNAEASGAWRTVDATQNGQDGQRVRVIGDFGMQVRQSRTNMGRLYNI
jgi:hypothetical protein